MKKVYMELKLTVRKSSKIYTLITIKLVKVRVRLVKVSIHLFQDSIREIRLKSKLFLRDYCAKIHRESQ